MHSNGNGPSLDELHITAMTQARRSGYPRWVVSLRGVPVIIDPDDWTPKYDRAGRQMNMIERVAYPEGWGWRR